MQIKRKHIVSRLLTYCYVPGFFCPMCSQFCFVLNNYNYDMSHTRLWTMLLILGIAATQTRLKNLKQLCGGNRVG